MLCKHNWKKESDVIMKPDLEQLIENLQMMNKFEIHKSFISQTHVVILSCKKCGKIYRSITRG